LFIFVYTLTWNSKLPLLPYENEFKIKKTYKMDDPYEIHIEEQDASRNFELQRYIHPLMPPLRRGPFNLSRNGLNRRRFAQNYNVFNQMGYLHNVENNDQAMPLMGRMLHSQQYEYYTFHHNNPDIKIPIKINGDKEILNDDDVSIPSYPNTFKAKIYDLDTPRYVPY
jgi:hypothetical protein